MAKTPEYSLKPQFNKNWLINGDMRISQRATSFASVGNGVYTLDRFIYNKSGAMVHTISQDSDVPAVTTAGQIFPASLRMNLITPDTAIAAGEFAIITQHVEGYNFANIAGSPLTLSFWVKAVLPGTYCIAFRNSGLDRSYVLEYTINATNTWEYKTVTMTTGSPSSGTWNYTNGSGLQVSWVVAGGTSVQTTAGAWQSGNFLCTSNQVNGVNTGATDFRITGVKLNAGGSASPFSLFADGYEAELLACQRYYEVLTGFTGHTLAPGTIEVYQRYKVEKRAATTPFLISTVTARASAGTPDISTGTNNYPNLVASVYGFWTQWTGWNNSVAGAIVADRGTHNGLRNEAEIT